MLRRITNNSLLNFIVFVGLLILLVYSHVLHEGEGYVFEYDGFVSLGLLGEFKVDKLFSYVLTALFIFLNASLINRLFNQLNIYEKTTLLPGVIYLLLITNTQLITVFDGAIVFHSFLIISLLLINKLAFNTQHFRISFDLGILMGIGTIFFPVYYPLLPFFYFVILSLKSFKTREYLVFLAGCIIPQLFALFYLYVIEISFYDQFFNWYGNVLSAPLNQHLYTIIITLASLVSLFLIRNSVRTSSLHIRKFTVILLILLVAWNAISIYELTRYHHASFFQLIILPLTLLLAIILLLQKKNLIPLILFYSMLIFSFFKFFFT